MELVDVNESVGMAVDRTLVVAHSATTLTRGLDLGEAVVLRTADGEQHAARVSDIVFELEDTVYTFDVGARLPEHLARERIAGLDPEAHDLAMHELVDLLGEMARPESSEPEERP